MDIKNTEEEKIKADNIEDAELDKKLEESIEAVKAGKELTPDEEEVKTGEAEVNNTEAEKSEEASTPPSDEATKEELENKEGEPSGEPSKQEEEEKGKYEFRVPNKGRFESDEAYEKRIELLDLVKRRKLAKTDEQRQELSADIKTAKNQLKTLNGTDRFINPLVKKDGEDEPTGEPKELTEEEKALAADKERLKQLGGATKKEQRL